MAAFDERPSSLAGTALPTKPRSLPQGVWECVSDRVRCETLAALDVMDTHADEDFATLNRVAAAIFDTPWAAIAVVDAESSSLVSAHGMDVRKIALADSVAAHVVAIPDRVLIVPDASRDERFRDSSLVTGAPGLRFYLGAPIVVRGQRIGAFQVFAPEPRPPPDERLIAQFADLAVTVGRLFELKDEARVRERTAAELIREEWRHALTLEAGKVGSWVWDIRTKEIACNDILRRMYGLDQSSPVTSEDLVAATEPADRAAVEAAIQRTFGSGVDYEAEYRIAATGRWLVARGRVYQRDADGVPLVMMGVNIDVTEAREAADHTRLLLRELNHRVKNTLAMIQAIARQTLRRSTDANAFLDAFSGRLRTLSEAHSLLSDRDWAGISLVELVESRVRPYLAGDGQLRIRGEDLQLPPDHALALGLVIHELTVNAARYGALSTEAGRVTVAWTLSPNRVLEFTWKERGGPEPVGFERGFGTELIERGLDKILDSTVAYTLGPEGAEAEITMPLPAEA